MLMDITDLHNAVAAVCPIIGVSIGNYTDKTTWVLQFAPSATPAQQAAGQAVLQAFDPNTMPSRTSVTRLQAMVALSNAGLLTTVQNWVNTQNATTQLIWQNATNFTRGSTLIAQAAAALNLTSAQLDQLFTAAAQVNP